MSGYSDTYKGQTTAEFLQRWAPNVTTEPTPENLRWNIARARAAEAELERVRYALQTLVEFVR